MSVLGIDTSTRFGSVALLAEGRLQGGVEVAGPLDHSERLLPSVEYLLSRLGLAPADLRGIAVTVGPGSFTGVRVGLASARGLARSAGLPSVGVPSLEALAHAASSAPDEAWICPWIQAGRGEVYAAAYTASSRGWIEVIAPSAAAPERWLESLPACRAWFVGDGAEAYRGLLEERRGGGCVAGPGPWFLAGATARLGEARLLGREDGPGLPLEPVYLRPSDAERGRGAP